MNESMLEKIQKLLRKAESTTFGPEAEALYAKAQELMLRHAIDEEMIRRARPAEERMKPILKDIVWSNDIHYKRGKTSILATIAVANRVRFVTQPIRKTGPQTGWLVGFPDDIAFVEMLYASLLIHAFRDCREAWKREKEMSAVSRDVFTQSFLVGFAGTIRRRLEDANAAASSAAGDRALVLVDRRNEVDALMNQYFKLASPRTQRGRIDRTGLDRGRESGERANLRPGSGNVQGRTTRLLS